MSYYKFRPNDLFVNTIEAYPDVKFYIQSGTIYINDRTYISGNYSDNITGVPRNYTSLFEYNINRKNSQRIYPYVIKGSSMSNFKNISKGNWSTQYNYDGEQVKSRYNISSSITRYWINSETSTGFTHFRALKNVVNHYKYLSPYYDYETYYEPYAKGTIADYGLNMICIPSIYYGSSIRKGSVSLRYYLSGTLMAQASDSLYNGELVQVSGSTTGSVIGTILYNEGIILLSGGVALNSDKVVRNVTTAASSDYPRWAYFGVGANDETPMLPQIDPATGVATVSASAEITFQGVNQVETMTMLAKAPYAELNNSNNPTYLKNSTKSLETVASGTYEYKEGRRYLVNVVPSDYTDVPPPMQKETYISKIALYDEHKNVIGYAKLATPVRKTEDREFIFKLKLDL